MRVQVDKALGRHEVHFELEASREGKEGKQSETARHKSRLASDEVRGLSGQNISSPVMGKRAISPKVRRQDGEIYAQNT